MLALIVHALIALALIVPALIALVLIVYALIVLALIVIINSALWVLKKWNKSSIYKCYGLLVHVHITHMYNAVRIYTYYTRI